MGCFSGCGLCGGGGCWISMLFWVVAWWLVVSALVYYTWNHVIQAVTSAKAMRFTQALLLVFTMAAFFSSNFIGGEKGCKRGKGCASKVVKTKAPDEIVLEK